MRFLLSTVLVPFALALAACGPTSLTSAPAPLAQTTIDDRAFLLALSAFDAALTSVDALVASGYILPGSPRALAIDGAIQRTKDRLRAASAAKDALSTPSYIAAMEDARAAISAVRAAIKGD